jgi:hypothetical protein
MFEKGRLMKDDILLDFTIRIIVDDVSPDNNPRSEFRASVYDEEDLLADGWGDTIDLAIRNAVMEWTTI